METTKVTKKSKKTTSPAASVSEQIKGINQDAADYEAAQARVADPSVSLNAWNQVQEAASGVTVEQLDEAGRKYQAKYEEYEKKKKEASKLNEEAEVLEAELIGLMEASGKDKYIVKGIGTFYFSDKLSVQTPKTIAEKKALAAYITKKYGDTVLWDKLGINSQTLQSFYAAEFALFNERSQKALEAGLEFNEIFTIPGLNEPTNRRSLNLRKEK